MAFDRSTVRNVFIHDAQNRGEILGGLYQPPEIADRITNQTFLEMINIIVHLHGHYTLEDANGTQIERDTRPLLPGHYYIMHAEDVAVLINDELVVTRTMSLSSGTRVREFSRAVRQRDGGCVVTREPVLNNLYKGFEAAHVFPLAHQQHWNEQNFSRWITIRPNRGGSINSVQNGLLMRSDIHQLFDDYEFSFNPNVCSFPPRARKASPNQRPEM